MTFRPLFKLITVDHECVTSRSTPDSSTIAFAVSQHKVDQHMQAGHTSTSVLRGTKMFTEYKHWTVLERYVLTTDNSVVILIETGRAASLHMYPFSYKERGLEPDITTRGRKGHSLSLHWF
jgi:hypothetical protein